MTRRRKEATYVIVTPIGMALTVSGGSAPLADEETPELEMTRNDADDQTPILPLSRRSPN